MDNISYKVSTSMWFQFHETIFIEKKRMMVVFFVFTSVTLCVQCRPPINSYDYHYFFNTSHLPSITDQDGRCLHLLSPSSTLQPGYYRLTFTVKEYFEKRNVKSFFPYVEVCNFLWKLFNIFDFHEYI